MKQIKLNKVKNYKCDLIFFNKIENYIKTPKRIFFLSAKKNCVRGNHAHKKCNQFFISIKDKILLNIDNGVKEKDIVLYPGRMLKVKPLNWVKVKLEKDQSVIVICDKKYSKNEYIRKYSIFKKYLGLN